jgi:DNA-binding beta-propeller fold protein YncE
MALSRDGATLYVVSGASDTVVSVNIANNQVVGTWSPPNEEDNLFSVATSANHNWVLAAWSTLFRFDGPTPTPIWVPSNGDARILRMAVSSDGYQLYYTQQYRSAIYMTDTVTWEWTDQIPVPTTPTDLRLSPDGRFLFSVHRESGTIRVIDRNTTETVEAIEVGGDIIDMNFASDGLRFFVVRRGNPGRVLVYSIADPNDHAAPFVVGVDPYNGAPDVSANAVLRVQFSEPMDRVTLASDTYAVSGGAINPGHGELIFSPDNLTAYFVPEIPFDLGTTYQIGVASGLRDLSGNPLRESFQSSFQIAQTLAPAPGLSMGPTSGVTGSPYYITTMMDGNPVLVSNYYSNSLAFHDPETLTQGFSVNREKRTGRAMAVDGDRAWVSYPENGELVLVNVSNGQVEDTLDYVETRRDEALSPDRTKLGLVVGGDPAFLRVSNLDPLGKEVSTQVYDIWDWPRSLQFAPDNSYVYLGFYGEVSYLNLTTGKIERSFSGWDIRQTLLSPDGRTIYAVEYGGARIGVYDVATARKITALPVGEGGEWSMALSPDGLLLAVNNYGDDTIYFFDTYTNNRVTTHTPGTQLQAGTFSRDGTKYYYTWDGESSDGVTALLVTNPRPAIQPSPTPTNTPVVVATPTHTPVIGPTPTPTTGTEPTMLFDLVTDGFIDSMDLLKLVGDGSMGSGGSETPTMFEFSLHWRNGQRR